MRAHAKRYGLTIAASSFLLCLGFVAYAHMRYAQAERVYLSSMHTVTFRPHVNVVGELDRYSASANHWLALQAVGTGAVLLASVFVVVQVWQQRTARMRQPVLTGEAPAE